MTPKTEPVYAMQTVPIAQQSAGRAAMVRAVEDWLYRLGDYPGDRAVEVAMQQYMADWVENRANGLDVLASHANDSCVELAMAVRDLA